MMPPDDWYYSVQPITENVSKEVFEEYIKNYPRKLVLNESGICTPTYLGYDDFELADKWPFSNVAWTYDYDDDDDPEPEDERTYYITVNIAEVFASKTGRTHEDWEKEAEEDE